MKAHVVSLDVVHVYYVLDINCEMDFLFVNVIQAEQSLFFCLKKSYTVMCSD
jgi:hypothetical protein